VVCPASDLARDTAGACLFTGARHGEQALVDSRCVPADSCARGSARAPTSWRDRCVRGGQSCSHHRQPDHHGIPHRRRDSPSPGSRGRPSGGSTATGAPPELPSAGGGASSHTACFGRTCAGAHGRRGCASADPAIGEHAGRDGSSRAVYPSRTRAGSRSRASTDPAIGEHAGRRAPSRAGAASCSRVVGH
jgi:hypothetical protein